MELSEKASAFSIESLISSSVSDERGHNRNQSAEIRSWSVLSRQLIASRPSPRGGERAAPGPAVSAPLGGRAASLIHQISVQDDHRRTLYQESVDFVRERSSTRLDSQKNRLFLGEGGFTDKHTSAEKSHRRSLTSSMLLGPEYRLQHQPSSFQDDVLEAEGRRPAVKTSWETACLDDAPDEVILPDEPISIVADGIRVSLENSRLWKRFNKCGTEMIVNRVGRRMFPCIVTTIRGLDPAALYRIQMELMPTNRHRYKFINGKWLPVGKADPEHPNKPFEHPDSPSLGAYWMHDRVSFAKLKITNNKENAQNNTVLHSMHKYTPRIIITKLTRPAGNSPRTDCQAQRQHPSPGAIGRSPAGGDRPLCFEFQETSFIAVTAYHSDQITQLKIQHNPFAKAFRDADVTAILRGTHMLSEPAISPMQGQVLPMHPTFQSSAMEWQSSSSMYKKQDHTPSLSDTIHREYKLSPTFPGSRSSLGVSIPQSTTVYPHQGLREYRSQPSLTKQMSVTSPHYTAKHQHSKDSLRDYLHRDATVNRSRSHPEISFRRVPGAVPTSTPHHSSDFGREFGTFHPLRRVSSTAESRSLKRYTLPYYSPRKVLFPRFEESQRDGLRRHSDEGESLLSHAGNLRGKLLADDGGSADSFASVAPIQQTVTAPSPVASAVGMEPPHSTSSHTSYDSSFPHLSDIKETTSQDTIE